MNYLKGIQQIYVYANLGFITIILVNIACKLGIISNVFNIAICLAIIGMFIAALWANGKEIEDGDDDALS